MRNKKAIEKLTPLGLGPCKIRYTKEELISKFRLLGIVSQGFWGRIKAELLLRFGCSHPENNDCMAFDFDKENGLWTIKPYGSGIF